MNIISWNCNMAFRKKWQHILPLQPDIMIIQECESPEKFKKHQAITGADCFLWFGDNVNKGVGIITFNGYKVSVSQEYEQKFRYIIPLSVSGPKEYKMFAIWAMPHKEKSKGYVGQIWQSLQHYSISSNEETILAGDFNSNAIWDKERPKGNHSDVISHLEERSITSVYHHYFDEVHGQESQPTLYLLKQETKPYHLDYCCVSESLLSPKTKIRVGQRKDWLKYSDHMPIIVTDLE